MNFYSIPPLVVGSGILLFGLTPFLSDRRAKSNILFALLATSAFWWLVGYAIVYSTSRYDVALQWCRWLYIGVIFIPVTSFHFVTILTQRKNARRFVPFVYAVGFLFAILTRSDYFISGLSEFYWGFQTKVGPLHNVFLAFFLLVMGSVIYFLLDSHRRARLTSPLEATRLKYVLLSHCISVAAALDFLPNYGLQFYPFGFFFIAVHAIMTTYALARYRLLDTNIAVVRVALFVGVFALLIALPLVLSYWAQPILMIYLGQHWLVLPMGLMAFCGAMAPLIFFAVQRKAEARLLKEQRQYQATLMNAAKGMVQVRDLNYLLRLIVHLLTRAMKLTHAGVFLQDERAGKYVLQSSRDRDVLKLGLILGDQDPLIQWLRATKTPLVYEELKQRLNAASNGAISPTLPEATLQKIEAAVVVPSFAEDELIGFLVLGDKKTGQMYSQDDLNVLQTLANQAALAIQNAQFYQELQTKTAELIHESKLKSMGKMASGMSHQINNRMACLVAEASSAKEQYLTRLRVASSEAEREALVQQLEAKLDSICEEGIKGSTIVRTLLEFSKPTTTFAMTSLEEVIRGGLKMVGLKHELHQLNLYVHVPKDHPGVRGNVSQLQDVFFNLIDNACDAIAWKANSLTRGTLQAPAAELPYQGQIAVIATLSEDRAKHVITVADNGLGMTPEDADRLFLPFHTTKGTAEKGTGLGLFVIREMLKGHRGDIRLKKSEYGAGTTFLVEIPVPEEERR